MSLSNGILMNIEKKIDFSNDINIHILTASKKTSEVLSNDISSELKKQTNLLNALLGKTDKSGSTSNSDGKNGGFISKIINKFSKKETSKNLEKVEKPLKGITKTISTLVLSINELDEKKFDKFLEFFDLGKKILGFALLTFVAAPLMLISGLILIPILWLWVKLFEYIGSKDKDIYKGSKTLLYIATSTAIVVLTIVLSAFALGDPINLLKSFLLVAGSMMLLVGAYLLISMFSKYVVEGGKTMLFLALTTAVTVGIILLTTYILSEMSDDTKDNMWGAFGLVIGSMLGIVGAYYLISNIKSTLLQGGATMLFLGIATALIVGIIVGVAYLLLDLQQKSGEQDTSTFGIVAGAVGIVVISLLSLAFATALIGTMSGEVMPGALGLLIISASMGIFSLALMGFVKSKVTGGDILLLTGAVTGIAALVTLIGNPITVLVTLAGAAAMLTISGALLIFTSSLETFSNSKWDSNKTDLLKNTISEIVHAVKDAFSDFSLKDFAKTLAGVALLGGIGNSLSSLGKGLGFFANLELVTFKKDANGELVVDESSSKTAINPQAIGQGIKAMIQPLIGENSVLAELGKNEGLIFNGPIGNGIALLGKLGNAIGNFAKGLINIADLKIPVYDENGILIKDKYTSLSPDFSKKVGESIQTMVTSLTGPLEELGSKDGGWFSSTNFEKGLDMLDNLGKPLNNITNLIKSINVPEDKSNSVENTLNNFFNPINSFFSKENIKKMDVVKGQKLLGLGINYIEKLNQLKNTVGISNMFVRIGKGINSIDIKKLEKINSLTENLSNFAKEMKGNFSELSDVLEKLAEALGNLDNTNIGNIQLPSSVVNSVGTSTNNPIINNQPIPEFNIEPMVKQLTAILNTLQSGIEVEPKNKNMFSTF